MFKWLFLFGFVRVWWFLVVCLVNFVCVIGRLDLFCLGFFRFFGFGYVFVWVCVLFCSYEFIVLYFFVFVFDGLLF